MLRTGMLAILLVVIKPNSAQAAKCESVNIAYYQGPAQQLGDIYYERSSIKFWQANWSAERVSIKAELNEKFMMDEMALSLDCNDSVWLYPVEKNRKKDWIKIGKLASRSSPVKSGSNDESAVAKDRVQDILIHIVLDVVMHCILK